MADSMQVGSFYAKSAVFYVESGIWGRQGGEERERREN